MGKSDLTSIAAATMSFLASVLLIFVPDIGPDSSWQMQLVGTGVGTLSLYLFFASFRWALFRLYYRRLLGSWYYSTRPHEDIRFKDANFALMTFSLGLDGDLSYKVDLYESLAALKARDRSRRGCAASLALTYSVPEDCVELVFRVEYFTGRMDDMNRKGRLSLHFSPAGLLEGDYISEVWEDGADKKQRAVSSGRMIAARTIYDLEKAISEAPEAAQRPPVPA